MANLRFKKLFGRKPVLGMIHLAGDSKDTVPRALKELEIFQQEGLDGAIVENYLGSEEEVGEVLKLAQKEKYNLVLGVNILPNEYFKSMNLAGKYGAKFIQLDYVAGKYLNGGLVSGRRIQFELDHEDYCFFREKYPELLVLGGVHPKYYNPAPESDLAEELRKAVQRADAIVVTGKGTGLETPIEKVNEFRRIIKDFSLIVGAGLNPENAYDQLSIADGAIVGSALKVNNAAVNNVDRFKVRDLMDAVKYVRNGKRV